MNEVAAIWSALDLRRKVIVVAATLGVFAAILALARMASTPQMVLLYSGLDAAQSGEVIDALESGGVPYDVRSEAIFVPESRRDSLRMRLATEGIPNASGGGYEILDGLSGFGTTAQMFDAAYWRAKEGELARTILASPDVKQVRVHIGNPVGGSFRRDIEATASVMVTSRIGSISSATAEGFRFLVASAVQGVEPDRVTIIDAQTGRVIGAGGDDQIAPRAHAEEAALRRSVERMLDARLGLGNSIVEVAIDSVSETERIIERRIDPQSRVAISTDVQENVSSETNGTSQAVTVASNLPNGDASSGGEGSQSQNSETRTVTNFDLSEVTRNLERMPGAIKRMTVAVLLNRSVLDPLLPNEASSQDIEELVNREIEDIRDLVSASVGFDEARGDQISVKAMSFGQSSEVGTLAEKVPWHLDILSDPLRLAQFAALALVTLILGLFVVRPVLISSHGSTHAADLGDAENLLESRGNGPAPTEIMIEPNTNSFAPPPIESQVLSDSSSGELSAVAFDKTALNIEDQSKPLGIMVESLRHLVEGRQSDTVEILRSWIEDDKSGDLI